MEIKLELPKQGFWTLEIINPLCGSNKLSTQAIFYEPTGNCQSISFQYINNLLCWLTKEEFREVINEVYRRLRHPLILIDVVIDYKAQLENYLSGCTYLVKEDFVNTYRDHEMCLYLIDIRNIVDTTDDIPNVIDNFQLDEIV